jgi:uncharacterized protein
MAMTRGKTAASSSETPQLFTILGKTIKEILKTYKTPRIAVSGDVALNRLETQIIDTAEFQRLRSIKQLGTTYLVYPTALHTRFDHSLGTLAMANEMMRNIRENLHNSDDESRIDPEQELLTRLLALLHDIGHLPFGHTIEDEFCIFPRHDQDSARVEAFLGSGSTIGKLITQELGTNLYDRFMAIYRVSKETQDSLGEDAFIYDLVNNTVCADLLDYLRRDCYFCNIALDMDYRFLKYLYLERHQNTKRVVVRLWKADRPTPRRDVLSELVRLLDHRYLLAERLYFHHAKLITGAMISGAVQRAKTSGELKQSDMYSMGDDTLLDKLSKSKQESITKLIGSIRERKLWKTVYTRTRREVEGEQETARNKDILKETMSRWWKDADGRAEAEDWIAESLGMRLGDALIYCPDARMSMKLAEMKVLWNGSLKALKDCEDDPIVGPKLKVILDSHQRLWAMQCFANPQHLDKCDSIVDACDYLFSYNQSAKRRNGENFFRHVTWRVIRDESLAGLDGTLCEEKTRQAVERLMVNTKASRNYSVVKDVVRDAFK